MTPFFEKCFALCILLGFAVMIYGIYDFSWHERLRYELVVTDCKGRK